MKKSERLLYELGDLRNSHIDAEEKSVSDGEAVNAATHAMAAEMLHGILVRVMNLFGVSNPNIFNDRPYND